MDLQRLIDASIEEYREAIIRDLNRPLFFDKFPQPPPNLGLYPRKPDYWEFEIDELLVGRVPNEVVWKIKELIERVEENARDW